MDINTLFPQQFWSLPPIRQFQIIWCGLIAVSLALDFPRQVRFYRWFSNSGLEMAKYRGYGQTAGKLYGVIPAPKLSVGAMACSGLGLICALLCACTSIVDPRLCLILAALLYHCYVPQLYCEIHMVAHNTALMLPAMLICIISPDIVAPAVGNTAAPALAQQWPIILLRFVITSAYCSAACCKVYSCYKNGVNWLGGATMQGCVFEAIMGINLPLNAHFTFWVPTPFARVLQRWLFRKPMLLGLMSLYGVIIELVAPAALFFPMLSLPFAILGVGLHYGIAYCQNIDFLPWWGPFYVCFLVGDITSSIGDIFSIARAYLSEYPYGFSLGMAYVIVHVGGMIIHRYVRNIDMLPLSRFPMFDSPKNLWDGNLTHWAWLTEKEHQPGTLMTYAFPMHGRKQYVLPSELDTLPFKYLIFGNPPAAEAPVDAARPLTVYTNVVMTDALSKVVNQMFHEWHRGPEAYKDQTATALMLDLVDRAKVAFRDAPRKPVCAPIPESEKGLTEPLLASTLVSASCV